MCTVTAPPQGFEGQGHDCKSLISQSLGFSSSWCWSVSEPLMGSADSLRCSVPLLMTLSDMPAVVLNSCPVFRHGWRDVIMMLEPRVKLGCDRKKGSKPFYTNGTPVCTKRRSRMHTVCQSSLCLYLWQASELRVTRRTPTATTNATDVYCETDSAQIQDSVVWTSSSFLSQIHRNCVK